MLYMFGALTFDTRPFSAERVDRSSTADIVKKAVIGGFQPREFVGEGDDTITIAGRLLPTKIGGLTELELAHSMRRTGARAPLVRGDGIRLGWYAIASITESHSDLMRDGVGFTIDYQVTFEPTQSTASDGLSVISGLLSLFGI